MQPKMITGLHINTRINRAYYETIPNTIESYFEKLNATAFGLVSCKVGIGSDLYPSMRFNVICDNDILDKTPHIPSAIDNKLYYCFHGDLFVVGYDAESGDVRSLTKEERKHLRNYTTTFFTGVGGDGYQIGLTGVTKETPVF